MDPQVWTLLTFTPIICLCSSPFMKMHVTLRVKLPQFCSSGRPCFGKDPLCSPHLLQVINPSFSHSLAWLCLLAPHPPRGEPSFSGVTTRHAAYAGLRSKVCTLTYLHVPLLCRGSLEKGHINAKVWAYSGFLERNFRKKRLSRPYTFHPKEARCRVLECVSVRVCLSKDIIRAVGERKSPSPLPRVSTSQDLFIPQRTGSYVTTNRGGQ